MGKIKEDIRPLGSPTSWAKTPGTYISGQAHIDGADHIATAMELKWGAGRLRLLVSPELREKFDRQRYLFNQAIWHGDLEAVRRESVRMTAAWQALDKAAEADGAESLSPEVWEVTLVDGTVAAIVQQDYFVHEVVRSGRKVVVYTLDEIGRLLSYYPQIAEAKLAFPGATVEAVRRPSDPLDAFADTAVGLDDPLDDSIPHFGA
jgi:hypothetical protein